MRWQFDLRAFIPSVVAPRQRWHRSVADPPLAQRERNPRCNAPKVSRSRSSAVWSLTRWPDTRSGRCTIRARETSGHCRAELGRAIRVELVPLSRVRRS